MTTELFELPLVLIMTFALLISSYTCGIALTTYVKKKRQNDVLDDFNSNPWLNICRIRNL